MDDLVGESEGGENERERERERETGAKDMVHFARMSRYRDILS